MKHGRKKVIGSILALLLVIGVFTGCSNGSGKTSDTASTASTATSTPENQTTAQPKLDLSKKVELQFYIVGTAPKDIQLVTDEINKLTEKDLNATVKFSFTTWTDYMQKYNLLLASGEPIDLLYTAPWLQYQQFAKQGAFLPLDDLLPKAAPGLLQFIPKDAWDAARINGKIYTVPSTWHEYTTTGIAYREDLRKKYNLPVPDSLEHFKTYVEGLKKNIPDVYPLGEMPTELPQFKDWVTAGGLPPYGMNISYKNPREVSSYWGSPEQLEFLKMEKDFVDKGIISRNINSTNIPADSFNAGTEFVTMNGFNPNKFGNLVSKVKAAHPDWELGYYPFPSSKEYSIPASPIANGMAIPKSSVHPERALAFYEKMVTDKRYNWLTSYGIEGTNFEVKDGYYKQIGDGFGREGMESWSWRNPNFMIFGKSFDPVKDVFTQLDKNSKPNIFDGFAEDWSSYQPEKAALAQVEQQYLIPLQAGVVSDVEKGLKTFMDKAKQAGLEKIQAEYTKQWLQYLNEKGIK